MLQGVFRTKERKIIIAIMGLAVIITGIIIFADYSENKKFLQKAVMAENLLNAGSYEEAIEAYKQAMSMKNGDQELLTIGLAESYAGINEFDKALEVLRSYYQKTSALQVKEMIEDIISDKTDYEYSQSISRAEIYYNNKDFDKAITEFEKAKQIKSKEATAYKRITEAYIEMGKYEQAKEEVLEGQAITKDTSLNLILEVVDSYLRRENYYLMLKQASDYIYQENYVDGFAEFEKAIKLLPKESEAYIQLAQAYINQKEYEQAILLLQKATSLVESKEIKGLLKQASQYQQLEEEKERLLYKLYSALGDRNMSEVKKIMTLQTFIDNIIQESPIYYSTGEGDTSGGPIMIIYDSDKVYYGDISRDKKQGEGLYFMLTKGKYESGYYYYEGKWDADIPNGAGKTVEETVIKKDNDKLVVNKVITEGNYSRAREDGRMTKYFYIDEIETGRVTYTASMGIPKPIASDSSQAIPTPDALGYVIGILAKQQEDFIEYYRIESETLWGVKPFMNEK